MYLLQRCSIIGSEGYIGKHLNCFLLQKGIKSKCYDVIDVNRENYNKLDLTNKNAVSKINLDVDFIFFLAGLTGTYAAFDNYEKYVSVNELGMLHLLDAIRKSPFRPKIIFPSTRLVYKGVDKALEETDEKETKTIYAVNKLSCENALFAYYNSFHIPYTVFRICIPYGNLLNNDYSFGTIGFFLNMASSGKPITLYGDGSIKRTFTHIYDVCNQMVLGAFRENSNGETYNIGGETYALKVAATTIASRFCTEVVLVPWSEKDWQIESSHTYFDDTKIQKLIGKYEYRCLKDFSNEIRINEL